MKKHLALLITLFFSVQTLTAQAAIFALLFGDKVASENFNISLEIGGAFSSYSDLDFNDNGKFGLNFGIGGNVKLSENWFVSPNIYFLAQRNTTFNNFSLATGDAGLDAQFSNTTAEIELNYIDIPILVTYQTNNKKYRFSLAPQVSLLQKSRAVYANEKGEFKQNVADYMEDVDYGMVVDFGYVLGKAHKGKGVYLHARYYYGFNNVFKDIVSTSTNRNSYFSLHLTLPFITDELANKNLEED
ncbi:porin family protein [Lacinutrix jangbogonensis]|uniref:porin family protein n=1 Tax=Lacinutrix jangbogonensis TaxID=1469557 RepID=UPI00053E127F|nr:porin family protein [Lacinutrix jangbogonensis]